MAEYSEPGILKDTKNIQNEKFGGNQVRCMQEYLIWANQFSKKRTLFFLYSIQPCWYATEIENILLSTPVIIRFY